MLLQRRCRKMELYVLIACSSRSAHISCQIRPSYPTWNHRLALERLRRRVLHPGITSNTAGRFSLTTRTQRGRTNP